MKVWLVERAEASPRRASMWHWRVDFEQGCYMTKFDALTGAVEGNGKFRVSRWELKRVTPSRRKGGRK